MLEILIAIVVIAGSLTIIAYATRLLWFRLRRSESKSKSFIEWLKHVFEAVLGF